MQLKSRTVWWDEVNQGLFKIIKQIYGNSLQVSFRSDDDIQAKTPITYPRILITNLEEKFDRKRYSPFPVEVRSDDTTVTMEESAKPFNLTFQIDLISSTITEMNRITMLWNNHFIDFNNLEVVDQEGTTRSVYMKNVYQTKSDSKSQNGERLFKRTYIYEVRVEIDEVVEYNSTRPYKGLEF